MDIVNFPSEFYASDSIVCEETSYDYVPSAGWTAVYFIVNGTQKIVLTDEIEADINTDTYKVSLTAAQTAAYVAGNYTLSVVFTNLIEDAKKTKVLKKIKINPNFETLAIDTRSIWKIGLDNALAVFRNTATFTQKTYEIGDRKLESLTSSELISLIQFLEGKVAAETAKASGKPGGGKVYIKFTRK